MKLFKALAFIGLLSLSAAALAQSYGSSYGTSGTSYRTIGGATYGSNGTSYRRIGNATYGSDGTICRKSLNTVYCN